jgi:hypothetical protein
MGNYASVQICTSCNNGTVHINFMNVSLRMCKHQFKHFTTMLNDAMLKLFENEQYFSHMKAELQMYQVFGNTRDQLNSRN